LLGRVIDDHDIDLAAKEKAPATASAISGQRSVSVLRIKQ